MYGITTYSPCNRLVPVDQAGLVLENRVRLNTFHGSMGASRYTGSSISVDHAVMERTTLVAVVGCAVGQGACGKKTCRKNDLIGFDLSYLCKEAHSTCACVGVGKQQNVPACVGPISKRFIRCSLAKTNNI
jgi:hypothetical protein